MKISFSLLILLVAGNLSAQNSPTGSNDSARSYPSHIYHINGWSTGGIVVGGAIVDVLALRTLHGKPTITDAEFDGLNRTVFGIDSWALRQNTTNYLGVEKYATITNASAVLLPLTLFFSDRINKDWVNILALYLEVESVSLSIYIASPMGPLFQNKFRPIVYYDNLTRSERNNGYNRNSFYSGHVASAAAATFFMAKVIDDYNPQMGANKAWLYAAAAVPPLILGYIRMLGLNHFPSDIITGFGIGAACGIVIPQLHKISDNDLQFGVFSSPEATGLRASLVLN